MLTLSKPRKSAKGITCPTRPVAEVKGAAGKMMVGGSLGYLKLDAAACIAINPKRVLHALSMWSKKPAELNRPILRQMFNHLMAPTQTFKIHQISIISVLIGHF